MLARGSGLEFTTLTKVAEEQHAARNHKGMKKARNPYEGAQAGSVTRELHRTFED